MCVMLQLVSLQSAAALGWHGIKMPVVSHSVPQHNEAAGSLIYDDHGVNRRQWCAPGAGNTSREWSLLDVHHYELAKTGSQCSSSAQ